MKKIDRDELESYYFNRAEVYKVMVRITEHTTT